MKNRKTGSSKSKLPPDIPGGRRAVSPAGSAAGQIIYGKQFFQAGAALSFLVGLIVYVQTMAASASFWDAGEFIAASYSMGIPHSPGTPLYILVGRVFSILPLPLSVAVRVNLISAVCGALGAFFIYLLTVRFLDYMFGASKSRLDTIVKVAGGLAGALFITFSDTYWVNATEAEVYAMSCFLMGFITWIGLKWHENRGDSRSNSLIYLLFYLLALSVGFHLGTILAFSGVFFLILLTRDKTFTNLEFIIACMGVGIFVADATMYRAGGFTLVLLFAFLVVAVSLSVTRSPLALVCTGLFVLGLSVHLFLLIRSGHNPALDEGNPETWRGLYAVLRREQYPPMNILSRKASFFFQLEHFNNYFQAQFEMFSLYIGRLNIGSLLPIGLGLWGLIDQYARHKKSFIVLFITLLVTSLGLIVFLNFTNHEVRDRDYFYSPAFYYFSVFIGIGAASLINEVRKLSAKTNLPETGSVYAAVGIMLLFPILTGHNYYFAHDRSNNYVCRDYSVNMLKPLDKNSLIFTNGDNDTFPLWYIQEVENYRKDVRVINLSLLNTPWYIKQLRDNEPRVPIRWSDDQIDRLQPIPTQDRLILVRDQAMQHILRENKWKRTVYFAVTIPQDYYAPYRDYLEMEGLVFRFVPRKGQNMISAEKIEDNVYNQYSYRSILDSNLKRDKSIYLSSHTRHLIQNYAAALCQVAYLKRNAKNTPDAVKALELAKEISPDIDPAVLFLGWYYFETGDTAKAINHYKEQIRRHPERLELFYRLAGVYERIGDLQNSLVLLDEIILKNPQDREAVLSAFGIAAKLKLPARARTYLTAWIARHPDDKDMMQALEELDKAITIAPESRPE